MEKLSKTQIEVIRRLQSGEKILLLSGIYARCYFHNDVVQISWATIGKLEDLELIERADRCVILTKKGKSYKL